ncbi:MAG: hypothetical protein MMC23_007684 [Stictis urceolatum]|nr:hypothetical protein [Stictis urceolata]
MSPTPRITIRAATPADIPQMHQIYTLAFAPGVLFRTFYSSPTLSAQASAHGEAKLGADLQNPRYTFAVACLSPNSSSTYANTSSTSSTSAFTTPAPSAPSDLTPESSSVVAFAKWVEHHHPRPASEWDTPGEYTRDVVGPGVRLEPYAAFFGGLRDLRRRIVKGSPHFILATLVTSPAHQGIGAGTALLGYVLGRMDGVNEGRVVEAMKRWGDWNGGEEGFVRERVGKKVESKLLDCYLEASPAGYGTYRRAGFEDLDVLDLELGRWGTVMTDEERTAKAKTWGEGNGEGVGGKLREGRHRTVFMVRRGRR